MKAWISGALLLASVVAMAAYCATHMRVVSDVASFMPSSGSTELAALSRGLTDSELTRSMVLSIGASRLDVAVEAARRLAGALRAQPEVAWVLAGADEERLSAIHALYFPRRHYFLSEDPRRELPERLADPGLRESARRLRAELARPSSPLISRIAGEDPLLAYPALLRRVLAGDRKLDLRDGAFVTRDGEHAIVFLGTRGSPFDAERQRPLLAAIATDFAAIRSELGAGLVLEAAGVNRFALDIEDGIRGEIPFLFGASTLGVAVVFLIFFRSPRALVLTMLPHGLGFLVAATVGLLVFGFLNGLAIAFGASLVGVTVDYAIHLLTHHGFAPPGTPPAETVRRLRPSLLLGGGTTIASFAGLAFADFPGFYQMGVLATVGVAVALAVSLLLLPRLMGARAAPRVSRLTAARLGARVASLAHYRRELLALAIACAALGVWGAGRMQWVDDLRRITPMNPTLMAEERRVRARISNADASRVLVARGATLEQALAANDRLAAKLPPLVRAGALEGFRSLHALLWSEALQRENRDVLLADASLPDRLAHVYAEEGFRAGAFAGFAEALASPPPEPLRYTDLAASSLADLARAQVIELPDGAAVVTLLEGVRAQDALEEAVADLPEVRLFDQKRFFREVYGEYRERIVGVVVSGCFAGLLLLVVRYRALRPALAAALPSFLVAGLLVAIAAVTRTETHILHVIGLLLVIGLAGDYGILMVDGDVDETELGTTMLSLLITSLTAFLTFGVMGLSAHPVLSAIGRTTSLGVALSFLLAPVSLVLVGGRRAPAAGRLSPS